MTKRTSKSKVVPITRARSRKMSKSERLRLAQEKVYDAWEAYGKLRAELAREALEISEDCVDAYVLIAEGMRDTKQRIEMYRKAVKAGVRTLGTDWEAHYSGACWLALETRPVMRAMASLAMELQGIDELQEALNIYQHLMKLNPNDNQGIRYQLVGCLYEAGCDNELEKLLAEYKDDQRAALLYTKALHFFRKCGVSKESEVYLLDAFKENSHVPIFLSDIVEMPDEPPGSIGFGDDSEAVAYVMDHGYLWHDTEGATCWMALTLETALLEEFDDLELVDEALKALKGEYEN